MAKRRFLYHILFWAFLFLLWISFVQNRSFTVTRSVTVGICYLVFIALDFYLICYFFIPKLFNRKRYLVFVMVSLGLVAVSSLMRAGVASFITVHFFAPDKPAPEFASLALNSFINMLIWVQCLTAGKMLLDRIRHHQYIAVIEQEKAKNELDFLKAQINPHFMFNSLNSIYGHIDRTNQTARNILLKFSEMLRYQLYECASDKIGIEKEMQYLRNFSMLQRYRKEENLIVNLSFDPELKGLEIAPLLLAVFVENAFKYVSNFDDKENRIDISLTRDQNSLKFHSFNTTSHHRDKYLNPHKGIGISNVKRRLELLYPKKHQLSFVELEETFIVDLSIDLT